MLLTFSVNLISCFVSISPPTLNIAIANAQESVLGSTESHAARKGDLFRVKKLKWDSPG
jgi:hypothetical protein